MRGQSDKNRVRVGESRREEKWQMCRCCPDQRRAYRMVQTSAEKLEHTGAAENERMTSVPQSEQLASTSLPKKKGIEPSVLITR